MREILPQEQNPALRQAALEILPADIESPRIKSVIEDMKALLAREKYGVALAAPQVGEPLRLFIVAGRALERDAESDTDEDENNDDEPKASVIPDQIYINPVLVKLSRGTKGKHEGCLSIRGMWGIVPRAEKAAVRAYDENGRVFTRGASGLLAHILQHELDHLDGILYTDKATELYEDEHEDHGN